jgi:hypothetical protein
MATERSPDEMGFVPSANMDIELKLLSRVVNKGGSH